MIVAPPTRCSFVAGYEVKIARFDRLNWKHEDIS
jgi:hypothetical protein